MGQQDDNSNLFPILVLCSIGLGLTGLNLALWCSTAEGGPTLLAWIAVLPVAYVVARQATLRATTLLVLDLLVLLGIFVWLWLTARHILLITMCTFGFYISTRGMVRTLFTLKGQTKKG
jgi:hypothetical protein